MPCKGRNITFTALSLFNCLPSSPLSSVFLRLTVSQHLFTHLFTHILPVLTHTCGDDVLTFPRLRGWRRVIIVWKEANRVKIRPGRAPTHRVSVGYRSRDLSAPSPRTKPEVVKPLWWRKDDEQLSENPCVKRRTKKIKGPLTRFE